MHVGLVRERQSRLQCLRPLDSEVPKCDCGNRSGSEESKHKISLSPSVLGNENVRIGCSLGVSE